MSDLIAILRIRGKVKVKTTIEDTMNYLNLTRVNHLSLFKSTKVLEGMLKKSQDYITFGVINAEVLKKLILKRARLVGDKKITKEWLSEKKLTIEKLVEIFMKNPKEAYELDIKKVFRLSPPSKGFERKGIKKPFTIGGVLGNRKEKINELLEKMI
jgi:large subunit ribosomal protein L30